MPTVLAVLPRVSYCSPSDLDWEEDTTLVLQSFLLNRNRPSDHRLIVIKVIVDAYEVVDLVGDGAEQNSMRRLTKSIIEDIAEETNTPVLNAIMDFVASVASSCDMGLLEYIMDSLKGVVLPDRLKLLKPQS